MENNENLVTEEVAENAEQTAEETPKLYTEDELNAKVNEITGKRVARREAKIRKEYESKYGDLVDTLRAGTGKESVEDITGSLKEYYEGNGVKTDRRPEYSPKEIEVLARAEAEEIIDAGYEEAAEEADRLAALGTDKLTAKEKAVLRRLVEYRQKADRLRGLEAIGVSEEVYNSKEFNDFAGMFTADTPISKVYETYKKTLPKKEFKTTGSMKSAAGDDNGVKEYYTPEEARRFTKKELDDNPAIFEAIKKSMPKWKR